MDHLWDIEQTAAFLDITTDEVRDLVDLGHLHLDGTSVQMRLDAGHVRDWRRGLTDGGNGGAAYLRQILRIAKEADEARP
jgi:hypothetical protein